MFFFKQKTAYEMRISDWSSDVGSSDLAVDSARVHRDRGAGAGGAADPLCDPDAAVAGRAGAAQDGGRALFGAGDQPALPPPRARRRGEAAVADRKSTRLNSSH